MNHKLLTDTVSQITSHIPQVPALPTPDALTSELARMDTSWPGILSTVENALQGEAGNTWFEGLTTVGGIITTLQRHSTQITACGAAVGQALSRGIGELGAVAQGFLAEAASIISSAGLLGFGIAPALEAAASKALAQAAQIVDSVSEEIAGVAAQVEALLAEAVAPPPMVDETAGMGGGSATQAQGGAPLAEPGAPLQLGEASGGSGQAGSSQANQAVQAALSAVGTPYQWGGNTPGVGLDCSGLTSWAYRQAGVELPRTADAQAIGPAIPQDQLQPGDLAVWDGHVAMYVGDGNMVEAGDPVQVTPVRTTNSGMNFLGFYRPTG